MRSSWLVFVGCLVLSPIPVAARHVVYDERLPFDRAVDAAAADYLANRCHVGLSIVLRYGDGDHFYNYGSTRRQGGSIPTVDSVYELASVTKTFIGAIAAKAVHEKRITLDGDFRTLLPENYPNLFKDGRAITLRTLATHTSGLQRDLPDSDAILRRQDYDHIGERLAALNKGFDRQKTLQGLHDVSLRDPPGAHFAYSNLGIRVIGYGLEHVYGLPLSRVLDKAIFKPLGMIDTTFDLDDAQGRRRVTPYSRYGHVQPFHDASAGAAYGLYSTSRDMARYLAWHLDERDPAVSLAHRVIRGDASDGEGLIWNIGRDQGRRTLWHGGGSFGETSQMVLFPDDRFGMVALTNDACEGSEGQLKAMALHLRHELP